MTCIRCQGATVLDSTRHEVVCASCKRAPVWCRCRSTAAAHEPLWLELARARRGGLSRDETGAAA